MYYQNNPDYDVLMAETRTFIGLLNEEIEEYDSGSDTITDDDCKRLLEQKEIAEKFLNMLESLQ